MFFPCLWRPLGLAAGFGIEMVGGDAVPVDVSPRAQYGTISDVGFVHGRILHGPVVVLDGFGVTDVAIILCSYHGP